MVFWLDFSSVKIFPCHHQWTSIRKSSPQKPNCPQCSSSSSLGFLQHPSPQPRSQKMEYFQLKLETLGCSTRSESLFCSPSSLPTAIKALSFHNRFAFRNSKARPPKQPQAWPCPHRPTPRPRQPSSPKKKTSISVCLFVQPQAWPCNRLN